MNRNETTETQEMKPPQGPLVPATYGQPIAQPVPIMTTVAVPVPVQVEPPDKQGGQLHIDPDKITISDNGVTDDEFKQLQINRVKNRQWILTNLKRLQ